MEVEKKIKADDLILFCKKVLEKLDIPPEDARIVSEVLVASDLRGIPSHGVARLNRYIEGIKDRMILIKPKEKIITDTPTTAVIDAGAGLGQPVSYRAMKICMEKAGRMNVGFATVRNSNHYGIAGFYSMMALEHNYIGISMSNTDVLAVPTFGKDAILGTNPMSIAVPAGKEEPFVLDMATTVVPRGKLEVYSRLGKEMPLGWATDENGVPAGDAVKILDNLKNRRGGGILPLGGAGEEFSGHKGYGLILLIEILSGILSGALYADKVYPKDENGKPLPSGLGHFFGAINIEAFRNLDDFKNDMDDLINIMKNSSKAEGHSRIYIHGEKEFEAEKINRSQGISLDVKVIEALRKISNEYNVMLDL